MKSIRLELFLIVFLVISIQSLGQKKITKLSNYAGKEYWIVEKTGFKGLKEGKDLVVPVAYDLVLPSLFPEFAFIIKNGNLGLYDIKTQRELAVERGFTAVNLYRGMAANNYVLVFGHEDDYYTSDFSFYVINRTNGLSIKKIESRYELDYRTDTKNGIEILAKGEIIHRFSHIIKEKNKDEKEMITLSKSIQKTGVYSSSLNKFVVPPTYNTYHRAFKYAYSSREAYNYFESAFYKKNATTGNTQKLYGLSNLDFKEIVLPANFQPMPFVGGYYQKTKSDSLYVFTKQKELLLAVAGIKESPIEINSVGNLIYVGFFYEGAGVNEEMGMNLLDHHIYSQKGELLGNYKFDIDLTVNDSVSWVTVQALDDLWSFLQGVFNVYTAKYVILPEYNSIRTYYYNQTLLNCKSGNCSFYYELRKGDSFIYLDQKLEPLVATNAIEGDFGEDYLFDFLYNSVKDIPYYVQIEEVDNADTYYDELRSYGIEVSLSISERELYSMDDFAGSSYDSYKNIEIVKMYSASRSYKNGNKPIPMYGLISINHDKFYLPPFFSKMEFNKKNNTLEFTYKDEEGSILLERYEY